MRPDMSKVIVERPRPGSRRRVPRRFARIDLKRVAHNEDAVEPLPSRIGHRRAAGIAGDRKILNENLAPLRRWLERQIGRRWDEVWSEISANVRADNTVQQHVRDHVHDFVAVHTVVRDGVVCQLRRWRGLVAVGSLAGQELYVDPTTGVLARGRERHAWTRERRHEAMLRRAALARRMRPVDEWCQLHLLADGNWWEVRLAPIPRGQVVTTDGRYRTVELSVTDVVHRAGLAHLPIRELYGRDGVYAVAKRPLSAREIKNRRLREPPSK